MGLQTELEELRQVSQTGAQGVPISLPGLEFQSFIGMQKAFDQSRSEETRATGHKQALPTHTHPRAGRYAPGRDQDPRWAVAA